MFIYVGCNPNPALKLTALPKLAKVKARASWLSILVPGRPVCVVIFNDTSPSAERDVKFLSRSIAPIQPVSIVVAVTELSPSVKVTHQHNLENGGDTAEGLGFDPEIASLIHLIPSTLARFSHTLSDGSQQ